MNSSGSSQVSPVVPGGTLAQLSVDELRPSPHNPRKLFDPEPLLALKRSIREHGVLSPLTVFKLAGQKKYAIIDGERRYKCCSELVKEGIDIDIPANIVDPPNPVASLLYMFNIHQFREQWELMPTALALRSVTDDLKTTDTKELAELTGLSLRQIERCKIILSFPRKYQDLSMDPDPKLRIPSNFWVELYPVLDKIEEHLPGLVEEEGRDGITDRMLQKYRDKRLRSVIHFRRILESFDVQDEKEGIEQVADSLREYILDAGMETRAAFDGYIVGLRNLDKAGQAAEKFIRDLRSAKVEHISDGKEALIRKLTGVLIFVQDLLTRLEGEDAPSEDED
ncbi:MAG: hypothetical protein BMS9Abin05_2136 [Rhodothermia bacterium]|nr:MAG: hypothetical protein BMS9Abin05_2136 [Rhodothermia bacterium]